MRPLGARMIAVVAGAFTLAAAGAAGAQTNGGAGRAPQVSAVDSPLVNVPVRGATAVVGHSFRPERRDFSESLVRRLRTPEGFRVEVFAQGLGGPRMIDVAADGWAYLTRPDSGDVIALRDTDGDGRADQRRAVVTGIPHVHGIAVDGERIFLADVNNVYVAARRPDGTVGAPRVIHDSLPDGGQHANRTLRVGADGMLYVTVGSLTNSVPAPDATDAVMLRMRPDGSQTEVYARNLRNTLGFGWHPATGEMWAMDHGIDWLGDDVQLEELNRIVQGGDYGWPVCYERREANPTAEPPEGFASRAAYCATTEPMVLGYTAHAAPMGLVFHTAGSFPAEYRGDAFVAMRGSWNRYPASGYEVVRVDFDASGRPVSIEPFVTGWLIEEGGAHFGRPVGAAQAPDGSLLVTDDTNGVLYRIGYEGAR